MARRDRGRWVSGFLSNQVLEYVDAPFTISSHAYGSIFYLMTGFHGLHVVGWIALHGRGGVATILGRTSCAPAR